MRFSAMVRVSGRRACSRDKGWRGGARPGGGGVEKASEVLRSALRGRAAERVLLGRPAGFAYENSGGVEA